MKVEQIVIEMNEVKYWRTTTNYFYKKVAGAEKWTRIGKAEWEQVFDEYMQTAADEASWGAEEQEAKEQKAEKAKQSDKAAEQAVNIPKKTRKSKNVVFTTTITLADDKIADVTLTEKQVKFIKMMPDDDFYENGLESVLWVDCFCDTIRNEFNAMSAGAMISTLKEKGLITVSKEKIDNRGGKVFAFTELGKEVAKELGLN